MEMTPEEVRDAVAAGTHRLIDVRGEDELARARIEGGILLSRELADEIVSSWPKDTQIVFYCHHGVRSLSAAHFFAQRGFTRVSSMRGGIDAWSLRIDPRVPRY
jgi:rhodanese-related sulfurtransferase